MGQGPQKPFVSSKIKLKKERSKHAYIHRRPSLSSTQFVSLARYSLFFFFFFFWNWSSLFTLQLRKQKLSKLAAIALKEPFRIYMNYHQTEAKPWSDVFFLLLGPTKFVYTMHIPCQYINCWKIKCLRSLFFII